VSTLDDYLNKLKNLNVKYYFVTIFSHEFWKWIFYVIRSQISSDTLVDYNKRIAFLKKLNDLNVSIFSICLRYVFKVIWYRFCVLWCSQKNQSSVDDKETLDFKKLPNPGPVFTKRDIKKKQLYLQAHQTQENQLRKELLKKTTKNDADHDNQTDTVAIDELIADHQKNQERIASEMLKSVQAIKENSLIAQRIVKKDNKVRYLCRFIFQVNWKMWVENKNLKVLSDLNSTAQKNQDNLRVENENLSTRLSKSCNCWIWLMIMITMIVFILMILFMRLFPKRKYYESVASNAAYDSPTYTHFIANKTLFIDNQTIHTLELWSLISHVSFLNSN